MPGTGTGLLGQSPVLGVRILGNKAMGASASFLPDVPTAKDCEMMGFASWSKQLPFYLE